MERHIIKLWIVLHLFLMPVLSQAQKWRPEFSIPLGSRLSIMEKDRSLSNFLESGANHAVGVDRCNTRLSIFYFRVNGKGRIDSVYSTGDLARQTAEIVKRNIYETEGKWKLPEKTTERDNCWFIFPFFTFGKISSCNDEKLRGYRQVQALFELLSTMDNVVTGEGKIMIRPNDYIFFDEK